MTGCRASIFFSVIFLTWLFVPLSLLAGVSPVVDVVRKASPAIVNIRTEELAKEGSERERNVIRRLIFGESLEQDDLYENIGSGVVIDPKGIIVTNEHLISKAINIRVRFINGKEYEAEVLGCDPEFDIAILKIKNGENFPFLKLKKRPNLSVGESVIVIGNPYGLSSSVSVGVISAIGRNLRVENKVFANLIQTDAAINPGNSGGALIDSEGNLIGIVTAILGEGKGIGFAIPASDIEPIVLDLMAPKRERPIVGIFFEKVKEGPTFSLLVKKVIEKSPAEAYGLKKGDRIVEINRNRLKEGTKLKDIMGMLKAREVLEIKILRANEKKSVNVNVKDIVSFRPSPIDSSLLGIKVSNLSPYTRLKYKIREKEGVVVRRTAKDGTGFLAGIRRGDVILKINNYHVKTVEDFERLMLEGIKRNYLLYQVLRGRSIFFLPLKLENLL